MPTYANSLVSRLLLLLALAVWPAISLACNGCATQASAVQASSAPHCCTPHDAAPTVAANCCCEQSGCTKSAGRHAPMCMCDAGSERLPMKPHPLPVRVQGPAKLLVCLPQQASMPYCAATHPELRYVGGTISPVACALYLLNQVFRT